MLTTPEPSSQMSLPGVDTPAPGSQIELPGIDQPQSEPARARNLAGRIKKADPADVANVYETQFARSIAWATGRTK